MIVGGYLFCCIMAWLIEVDLEADCAQISFIFFSHEPDCILCSTLYRYQWAMVQLQLMH